ncbi:hypothetical protein OSB04_001914 [Centaurea solstitialis]|uniref:F-box domain-containing protein n=1 Tax=Centaurea solstitialis TaxID=347529 RepID=A0AA38TRV4_9ASTR|nr:hypothetical protein OSB04_001914 [Centaurea solstitialis]
MEKTRNWLQMPEEIMGGMILQRLNAVEILESVQKVCRNWRRICKDPAMWKIIDMYHCFDGLSTHYVEKLSKEAVDRSCGELIDITLNGFCTNDLLDYISRCSSKLNCVRLRDCYRITGYRLSNALKRLPHLETLELSCIDILKEDIEVIGRNCPQLNSFEIDKTKFADSDIHAHAIANSMPALRHLKLAGTMCGDDGVQAILNGCPHLESLDICGCFYLCLDKKLEKLCRERIKDFKYICNNIPEGYEDIYDDAFCDCGGVSSDSDDFEGAIIEYYSL